jgi:hypothetical protein
MTVRLSFSTLLLNDCDLRFNQTPVWHVINIQGYHWIWMDLDLGAKKYVWHSYIVYVTAGS